MISWLPDEQRWEALTEAAGTDDPIAIEYCWELWARPKQLVPEGDWRVWMMCTGRGYGKTRTASEYVRKVAEAGMYSRIALVARAAPDIRDVVVEGESGILAVSPPWFRPQYKPALRRLVWPNGVMATTYSADEPDQLRGPQHAFAWADEVSAWRYPEAWSNLMLGLRLGSDPRAVVTTTPKPVKLVRDLLNSPETHVTRGSTYENIENLPQSFIAQIITRYEATRLGKQELYGELLEDVEGALWTQDMIDTLRAVRHPNLTRIVVAIDPAVTAEEGSDETGIIVAGRGDDGQGYVLDDFSCKAHPASWAKAAVTAYYKHKADRVIAETNNGGEMVELTLRTVDANVPYKSITATRGKVTRAEPIAALYEQGKVHHVGTFPLLEDQMTTWAPGMKSPDRIDALVWALTELDIAGSRRVIFEV